MVKMIRDNTGRFAERPFYRERDLDDECERLIRELLVKRHGKVDYPVSTDDLTDEDIQKIAMSLNLTIRFNAPVALRG